MSTRVDAVVIGSGPGGYPTGIRLGQLGVKAVVIEKGEPGGVCLNVGCIPSKALIYAAKTYDKLAHSSDIGITISAPPEVDMAKMQAWKDGVVKKLTSGVKQLVKANGSTMVFGTGRLAAGSGGLHKVVVTSSDGEEVYETKNVVIATGSRPVVIPGFEVDQDVILDSTGALALDEVPESLVVIGGGYIGLELGTVYAKLGSKVTVVEALPSLLSGMDPDCVKMVERKLRKMGVEIMLEAKAKSWSESNGRVTLMVTAKDGSEVPIDCDKILVSVGRRPNTEDLGLEKVGVKLDPRGYVVVDKKLRTNVPGIYAIGDVIGGMMLAHKATKEGEVVAEIIAGHNEELDIRTMPAVVFTDPEIAATGMTEAEATKAGHEIKVGKFPFAALGRALSVNDTDGFAKVVIDAKTEEILGVHIVGNGASDMLSEAALAIEMGAVAHDLALTVHPHPTLPEALKEAAAAAVGEAVHIINR